MANLDCYDPNSEWLNPVNIDNKIDHFFTQRKVIEYYEEIDKQTLKREKNKRTVTHNFLAINFPNHQFENLNKLDSNIKIDIEIWGDENYNYKGSLENNSGKIPDLLIKLNEDKQIFVKLIYRDNDSILKTFVNFIPVIKRYQSVPI